jgi:Domain of unknown function (DUF4349)
MRLLSLLLLLTPFTIGCAQAPQASNPSSAAGDITLTSAATAPDGNAPPASNNKAAMPPTAGRQIIYRATIWLRVKSFAEADRRITDLVKGAGGFIAQFHEERPQGLQRGGRWTVRVPVSQFDGFLDGVVQLGVADHRDVQSQDTTEEFVDLGSRLKNKQALEARLLELVAKRGDAIKDVLALEAELSRVREEIERLEGRLRFLSDRVALTTVEIVAYERFDFSPPEEKFLSKLAFTFRLSLDQLRQCAEAAALIVAALLPWAIVAALLFMPIAILIRFRLRRGRSAPVNAMVV